MSNSKKPRLCEVLGVEVNEKFDVKNGNEKVFYDVYIDKNGRMRYQSLDVVSGIRVCEIINGELQISRKPQFTPDELAVLRLLKRAGCKVLGKEMNGGRWTVNDLIPSLRADQVYNLEHMDLGEEA